MKVSAISFKSNSDFFIRYSRPVQNKEPEKQTSRFDFKDYKKPVIYAAAALAAGVGIYLISRGGKTSALAEAISASMSAEKGKTISPKSLACVMSGEELLKVLPKLEKKNYVFNPENVSNGVFRADLHSHSKYSDGDGIVKNLLDDAADYADKLYAKTKQKFIFALTDHDTVDGLKEAMEIISSDPKRFKNLQFVPGIELSFAHSSPKTSNECEIAEVLVYGVNPYSKKINNFLDTIRGKRLQMSKDMISEAAKKCPMTKFSFDEFSKYYEFEKYGNLMNIHWRTYNYIQTKQALTVQASNFAEAEPENFYQTVMENFKGASFHTLKENNKIDSTIQEEAGFKDILEKYSPHFEDGKLVATAEHTFENLIEAFKGEPNIFMAFAHPYYFTTRVNDPANSLKYFAEHSNGLLKASETFHQAYRGEISESDITTVQKYTENLGLLNLGGRDNHGARLL